MTAPEIRTAPERGDARIIVTGSRTWRDYDRLVHELAYVARWLHQPGEKP